MRAIRRADAGPRPAPPAARAVADYMFRLSGGKVKGASSLDEIAAMTADEMRAFAEANTWGGSGVILRAIDAV